MSFSIPGITTQNTARDKMIVMPKWLENLIQKFAEKNVIRYVIMHKSSIPGFQLHTHLLVILPF